MTSVKKSMRESVTAAIKALRGFDPIIEKRLAQLNDKLARRPIAEIIAMIPGETDAAKARACGVSRQTFHNWRNGTIPQKAHAVRLAKVTGFSIAEIRGSSAPATVQAGRVR
jgi:hypothetical protein